MQLTNALLGLALWLDVDYASTGFYACLVLRQITKEILRFHEGRVPDTDV